MRHILPVVLVPLFGAPWAGGQGPAVRQEPASRRAAFTPACGICHPGPRRGLARGAHRSLAGAGDRACLRCHTEGPAHQRAPRRTAAPARPCAACHEGDGRADPRGLAPRLWAHPEGSEAERAAEVLHVVEVAAPAGRAAPAEAPPSLSGFVEAGLRLVDVDGDQRRFDEDLGLDSGLRLAAFRLALRRAGDPLLRLEGRGFEDRDARLRFSTGPALAADYGLQAETARRAWIFAAPADARGFERERWTTAVRLRLGPEDGPRLFAGGRFERERGRRIGTSIVDPGASPLVPAAGIAVDTFGSGDRFESGLKLPLESDGRLGLELSWEDRSDREEFDFQRPHPKVPGLTQRETSRSDGALRGPRADLDLELGRRGGVHFALAAAASYGTARSLERGHLESDDGSPFTKDLLALGSGSVRAFDLAVTLEVGRIEEGRLALEAFAGEFRERLHRTLFETTARTSPPGASLRTERRLLVTRRKERGGALTAAKALAPWLEAEVGYRYAHQYLSVPDFEPGDADFRAGRLERHGPSAVLRLFPSEPTRVRLTLALFETGGQRPTETEPERARSLGLRIRHDLAGGLRLVAGGRLVRAKNPILSTEREVDRASAALSGPLGRGRLGLRAAYERTRSRTLSTFFAPPPTPLPTLVGFRGHRLAVGIDHELALGARWRLVTAADLDRLTGTLGVQRVVLRERLTFHASEDLDLGLVAAAGDFDERAEDAVSRWQARWAFLYGTWRF